MVELKSATTRSSPGRGRWSAFLSAFFMACRAVFLIGERRGHAPLPALPLDGASGPATVPLLVRPQVSVETSVLPAPFVDETEAAAPSPVEDTPLVDLPGEGSARRGLNWAARFGLGLASGVAVGLALGATAVFLVDTNPSWRSAVVVGTAPTPGPPPFGEFAARIMVAGMNRTIAEGADLPSDDAAVLASTPETRVVEPVTVPPIEAPSAGLSSPGDSHLRETLVAGSLALVLFVAGAALVALLSRTALPPAARVE